MGRLSEAIEKLLGFKTKTFPNPLVGALQVGVTRFLNPNADRLAFLIVNTGVNAAYILNAPDVAAANGILLAANGGNVFIWYKEDMDIVGDYWYGMAPAGAVNIVVREIVGK